MRLKLQLRTNVQASFRFILLVAALLFTSFQSYAQLSDAQLKAIKEQLYFFKNRYTKSMVWDCQRSPADAVANEEWELSGFAHPYDVVSGQKIDFGINSDRYVQFDLENWKSENSGYSYITDDSENKLVLSLKLYEANGTFVSIVSNYGTIQGLGADAKGLFYEQQEQYGTFCTMQNYNIGDAVTYTPETSTITTLSQLGLVSNNGSTITTDNDKGLIIEASDKYKEEESDPIKNFDGTIHAAEINSLQIGKSTDASIINILIKETIVKPDGDNVVTRVTSNTTATLTLSGTTDLGILENNGSLTFKKENGTSISLGQNTQIRNKGQFTDYTGLLTEVTGDAPIKMESTDIMNKQFTIQEGSSQEIVVNASTDSNIASLSFKWQYQNETSAWVDMPLLRSTASSSDRMTFKEAGQYRCLMTCTNADKVSTLTVYVSIFVTTPTPPPYIPTYYSVSLPEVEGVKFSIGSGNYVVEEGYNFSFTLTLKSGYEQSAPIVKANGRVIELNSFGRYIIRNVYEDQTVTIEGVVKDAPTAIDKTGDMIVKVWGTDGTLHVYTPQAVNIQIINFAGKLIGYKRKACGENLFDLPKGTYIVVVGRETIKIAL